MAVRPVRLQLSRKKGFSLQALSLATNGLPPVNVARPSKFGNPFIVGQSGGVYTAKVADRRHAYLLFKSVAGENERLVAAAREELAGKNLAWGRHNVRDLDTLAQMVELARGLEGRRLRYDDLVANNA